MSEETPNRSPFLQSYLETSKNNVEIRCGKCQAEYERKLAYEHSTKGKKEARARDKDQLGRK